MVDPHVATTLSPTTARVATAVVAAVFGLVVGSFLNVVAYRVPRGLSVVRPGSFCPSCGTPLRPTDNVPLLGWLVLRGRCRTCRSPISPRYPLVEGLTGALFAAVGALVGPHLTVPAVCALVATYVAVVTIELDHQASPPGVSFVGGGIGLVLFVVPSARSGHWWSLLAATIGAGAALTASVSWWLATRSSASDSRERVVGALCTLVPLGVLLGWVGASSIPAVAAGALALVVVTTIAGTSRAPAGARGASRLMVQLPLGSAAGFATGFIVAAALGALAVT